MEKSHLTPVAHLNGNSKDSMLSEWVEFEIALREAPWPFESLHMRNHYVKSEEDQIEFEKAKLSLITKLNDLRNEAKVVVNELIRMGS